MRMDKLTTQFQQALQDAQSQAVGHDNQYIEPVHLMSALLEQQGGSVQGILTKAGVNMNLLRSQLGEALDRLPSVEGTPGEVHVGNDLSKLLNVADKLAQERGSAYIARRSVPARGRAVEDRARPNTREGRRSEGRDREGDR